MKRLPIWITVLAIGAAGLACGEKKSEQQVEKKVEPAAKPAEPAAASAAPAAPAAPAADKKLEAAPPEAQAAMKGFANAARESLAGGGALGAGGLPSGLAGGLKGNLEAGFGAAEDTGTTALKLPPPSPAGGDCAAVASRVAAIYQAVIEVELAKLSPEDRAAMQQQLSQQVNEVRSEISRMCSEEKWSQQLKDCLLTAADLPALEKCEQYAPQTENQAKVADAEDDPADYTDDVPKPTAEAPAWTGGNSCDDVGQRLKQLYLVSMGDLSQFDPEVRKEIEKGLNEAVTQFADACKQANFNEQTRNCIVKARTLEATEECWQYVQAK